MKKIIILISIFLFAVNLYSQEIRVPVNGGAIYGILSIPEKTQTFPPAIIVAGSGATDKDGNTGTQLFRKSVQPYLISRFKFFPAVEIQKLSIPCLIINGGDDVQVSTDNADMLHKTCKKGKLVIIPNMTHTLKETSSTVNQLQMYIDPSIPVSKILIETISEFVLELK